MHVYLCGQAEYLLDELLGLSGLLEEQFDDGSEELQLHLSQVNTHTHTPHKHILSGSPALTQNHHETGAENHFTDVDCYAQ